MNYDDENFDYYNDNSDNIDAYDDDNDQKSLTTMTLWSKYIPFKYYYLVKKRTKPTGQGSTPAPPKRAMPV